MKKTVCIFGGSGFVGHYISGLLIEKGYRVRIVTRHPQRHKDMKVLPGLTLIQGTPADKTVRDAALEDCDVAINLVGILNEKGRDGRGFRKVHVDLAKDILQSCIDKQVPRLLHMSALNANSSKGSSHYLRSKGEAENYLHTFTGRNIHITSFKPSVIFGPGDSFLNRFAGLLKLAPVMPLACPDARFAPVYVGDVAEAFINAIDDKQTFGQRIELCGPNQYTLEELVEYTARCLGLHRIIAGLTDWASRLQAIVMDFVPGKPFSTDNYNSLKQDSICSQGTPCPTSIEAIAPYYLGKGDINTQLQNFRTWARRESSS
jgi:NADH dehydrogenase